MSEPFRDDLVAALDRADLLARENEELRARLARHEAEAAARDSTPAEAAKAPPPPDSLTRATLERLDALAADIDAHAAPAAPASDPIAIPAPLAAPQPLASTAPTSRADPETLARTPRVDPKSLEVARTWNDRLRGENAALRRRMTGILAAATFLVLAAFAAGYGLASCAS